MITLFIIKCMFMVMGIIISTAIEALFWLPALVIKLMFLPLTLLIRIFRR